MVDCRFSAGSSEVGLDNNLFILYIYILALRAPVRSYYICILYMATV